MPRKLRIAYEGAIYRERGRSHSLTSPRNSRSLLTAAATFLTGS